MAHPPGENRPPEPIITDIAGKRGARYRDKCAAIYRGADPVLFPGEFVQYLLDAQNISHAAFDKKIGCGPDYFRSDVFNTPYNEGSRPLPVPLQAKLAALTDTPRGLWMQRNFRTSDAEAIVLDMDRDISSTIKLYEKFGGRQGHLKRNRNDGMER